MVMVMMYGEAGGSRGRQDLGITDDVDEEMLIPASDSLFGFFFQAWLPCFAFLCTAEA